MHKLHCLLYDVTSIFNRIDVWFASIVFSLNKATSYEHEQKGNKPARKSSVVHGMISSVALQQYTPARGVCTSIEMTGNYPQQSSSPNLQWF